MGMPSLSLEGKVVIVTGAAGERGTGRAIALTFAEAGADVAVCDFIVDVHDRDLSARVKEIEHLGRRGFAIQCDVTQKDQVGAMVRQVSEELGAVDVLVNNAAIYGGGRIESISEEAWDREMAVNLKGCMLCCQAVIPTMVENGGGTIVNVIGTAGERQDFGYIAGSAGNASLMAFTRALGSRSADDNIRVVAVNPGMTETERLVTLLRGVAAAKGMDPDNWREQLKGLPFGRAGTSEEVADIVAFLASERASYISGTVVTIDGGISARGTIT